jgi:glycosyltransferase involved in cell wall biosynthesis
MKIVHLNHHGSNFGGVEGYIADVSTALAAAGHASHLIHFDADQGDLIPETTYIQKLASQSLADSLIPALERAITKFRPDAAYVHHLYSPSIVEWIARRLPTVAYVHSPHIVCPGYAQYLKRTSRVCPHKAGLICMLNAQIERCCFGRSPLTHARRLAQVYSFIRIYRSIPILVGSNFMQQLLHRNAIPLGLIEVLPPILLDHSCPEFAPAPDSRTMLFVGRLVPEKGLRQLIETLALLGADWELIVAGEGEERDACRALAAQLNVSHKVKFVGWLSQSEMESLYQRSSLVVVPSLWPEPFGRVGPEAFFHGRPVIAFAVGGTPDWLEDGVSGYLVPPGDFVQLRHRIQMLLESPERQVQMGNNARAQALKAWNADLHVNSLVHYLVKAINGVGAS